MEDWLGTIGKFLIRAGGLLVIIGVVLYLGRDLPILEKLGRLPGDIRISNDKFTFYFPLTTSILISLILTGIFWILKR